MKSGCKLVVLSPLMGGLWIGLFYVRKLRELRGEVVVVEPRFRGRMSWVLIFPCRRILLEGNLGYERKRLLALKQLMPVFFGHDPWERWRRRERKRREEEDVAENSIQI